MKQVSIAAHQSSAAAVDRKKVLSITLLFIGSIAIMLAGVVLGVISVINNATFRVLNADIPGVVFGAVVVFLGARYFLAVRKLKKEVYKSSSQFSWSNFRKNKTSKVSSKSR
jgi:cytochrome c biogenesis protein CcdA